MVNAMISAKEKGQLPAKPLFLKTPSFSVLGKRKKDGMAEWFRWLV